MSVISSLTSRTSTLNRRLKSNLNLLLHHRTTHPSGVLALEVDGLRFALDLDYPNQRHVYEQGGFERELTDIISRLSEPGDVFIDIGANFGWHSVALLARNANVSCSYAFEPSSNMFKLLSESIALNKLEGRCHARRLAITNLIGKSTLKTFADLDPMHASLYPLADWPYEEEEIELSTLDLQVEAISRPPSLIKCDVEGGERDVLLGAGRVLAGEFGPPPIWLLEANYEAAGMAGFFPWDLVQIATSHAAYEAHCIRNGHVVPIAHRSALRHGDTLILAIPELHRRRLAACA
jgi:FkbM family methyltransferase